MYLSKKNIPRARKEDTVVFVYILSEHTPSKLLAMPGPCCLDARITLTSPELEPPHLIYGGVHPTRHMHKLRRGKLKFQKHSHSPGAVRTFLFKFRT